MSVCLKQFPVLRADCIGKQNKVIACTDVQILSVHADVPTAVMHAYAQQHHYCCHAYDCHVQLPHCQAALTLAEATAMTEKSGKVGLYKPAHLHVSAVTMTCMLKATCMCVHVWPHWLSWIDAMSVDTCTRGLHC